LRKVVPARPKEIEKKGSCQFSALRARFHTSLGRDSDRMMDQR
jgi:hypothetical protein